MKVRKDEMVAFLVALGFERAPEWDDKKLSSRAAQVPEKVEPDQVPKGFENLYERLVKGIAEGIEISDEIDVSQLDKTALRSLIEERGLKISKRATSTEMRTLLEASLQAEKDEKVAKEKTEKAEKVAKEKAEKTPKAPRDTFGCRIGTVSAMVNQVIGKDWKSEGEIVEEAGVTLDQARGRLYFAAERGLIEYRKRIEYRLLPAAEAEKKE